RGRLDVAHPTALAALTQPGCEADAAALLAAIHDRLRDHVGAAEWARRALVSGDRHDALACLIRSTMQTSSPTGTWHLLDRLQAALPPDATSEATRDALALEVTALRPDRALALARRFPGREPLGQLVRLLREWLHHVELGLSWDERAVD